MKKMNLIILLTALASGTAYADYQCMDSDKKVSMTITENASNEDGNTSVLLVSDTDEIHLYGVTHSEGGLMLQKKVVNFHTPSEGQLIIVSEPLFCKRSTCLWDDLIITANLKMEGTQTQFSCQLTKHENNP